MDDTDEDDMEFTITQDGAEIISKLCAEDPETLRNWKMVQHKFVRNASKRIEIENELEKGNYAAAIMKTFDAWISANGNSATMASCIEILARCPLSMLVDELVQRQDEIRTACRQTKGGNGSSSLNFGLPFDLSDVVYNFTGRKKELEYLHELITKEPISNKESSCYTLLTSVYGLGGIGKTTLARKYILEYGSSYFNNHIYWLEAESHDTLRRSFLRLARHLKIAHTENLENDEVVKNVYAELANQKCLFVFDNVEEYHGPNGFSEFLPDGIMEKPYLLMTSRNSGLVQNEKVLRLDVLSQEDAVDLIQKMLPEANQESCTQLYNKMSCFPLALQQSLACIKNSALCNDDQSDAIMAYLEEYDKNSLKLHKAQIQMHDGHKQTIYLALKVSMDKIKAQPHGHLAERLLRFMAYLNPDNIQHLFLLKLVQDYGDVRSVSFSKIIFFLIVGKFVGLKDSKSSKISEANFFEAVKALDEYSVITLSENGILKIHRLVQDVVRLTSMTGAMKEFDIITIIIGNIHRDFLELNFNDQCVLHANTILPYYEKYKECQKLYPTFPQMVSSEWNDVSLIKEILNCNDQEAIRLFRVTRTVGNYSAAETARTANFIKCLDVPNPIDLYIRTFEKLSDNFPSFKLLHEQHLVLGFQIRDLIILLYQIKNPEEKWALQLCFEYILLHIIPNSNQKYTPRLTKDIQNLSQQLQTAISMLEKFGFIRTTPYGLDIWDPACEVTVQKYLDLLEKLEEISGVSIYKSYPLTPSAPKSLQIFQLLVGMARITLSDILDSVQDEVDDNPKLVGLISANIYVLEDLAKICIIFNLKSIDEYLHVYRNCLLEFRATANDAACDAVNFQVAIPQIVKLLKILAVMDCCYFSKFFLEKLDPELCVNLETSLHMLELFGFIKRCPNVCSTYSIDPSLQHAIRNEYIAECTQSIDSIIKALVNIQIWIVAESFRNSKRSYYEPTFSKMCNFCIKKPEEKLLESLSVHLGSMLEKIKAFDFSRCMPIECEALLHATAAANQTSGWQFDTLGSFISYFLQQVQNLHPQSGGIVPARVGERLEPISSTHGKLTSEKVAGKDPDMKFTITQDGAEIISELCAHDPEALANWNLVHRSFVKNPSAVLKMRREFDLWNYDLAILETFEAWISTDGNAATMANCIEILRKHELNRLVGNLEKCRDEIRKACEGSNSSGKSNPNFGIPLGVSDIVFNFTGRKKELEKLHKLITKQLANYSCYSLLTCVYGLGGIGKTTLARKYILEFGSSYFDNHIYWIEAESHDTLRRSFLKLARHLKIARTENLEIDDVVKNVYVELANQKCLFVFDNVEKYHGDNGVSAFLPSGILRKPYLLMTSRNSGLVKNEKVLRLDVLSEHDAVDLIQKMLPEASKESSTQLYTRLSGFPLALQQALLAFIRNSEILSKNQSDAILDYLEKYDTNALVLHKTQILLNDGYEYTIYVILKATIDKIESQTHGHLAGLLLRFMAYLNPDNIQYEFLFKVVQHYGDRDAKHLSSFEEIQSRKIKTNNFLDAVKLLDQYLIIKFVPSEEGIITMHRLVQDIVRLTTVTDGPMEDEIVNIIGSDIHRDLSEQGFNDQCVLHGNTVLPYYEKNRKYPESFPTLSHLISSEWRHINLIIDTLNCSDQDAIRLFKVIRVVNGNNVGETARTANFIKYLDEPNPIALYIRTFETLCDNDSDFKLLHEQNITFGLEVRDLCILLFQIKNPEEKFALKLLFEYMFFEFCGNHNASDEQMSVVTSKLTKGASNSSYQQLLQDAILKLKRFGFIKTSSYDSQTLISPSEYLYVYHERFLKVLELLDDMSGTRILIHYPLPPSTTTKFLNILQLLVGMTRITFSHFMHHLKHGDNVEFVLRNAIPDEMVDLARACVVSNLTSLDEYLKTYRNCLLKSVNGKDVTNSILNFPSVILLTKDLLKVLAVMDYRQISATFLEQLGLGVGAELEIPIHLLEWFGFIKSCPNGCKYNMDPTIQEAIRNEFAAERLQSIAPIITALRKIKTLEAINLENSTRSMCSICKNKAEEIILASLSVPFGPVVKESMVIDVVPEVMSLKCEALLHATAAASQSRGRQLKRLKGLISDFVRLVQSLVIQ